MQKKILIISQNFYPEIGSAGNRLKNIYQLLKEYNFDVNVLTTDPTYPNKSLYSQKKFWDNIELNKDNKNIKRIKIRNKKYTKNIFSRLIFYIEMAIRMLFYIFSSKKKYDVIYTTSPAIFIAIVGLIAKNKFKAKFILEIRDLWPESLRGVGVFDSPVIINIFKKIENLLYKQADKIIVNSKGFIDYIKEQSSSNYNKIFYVPNGARKHEIKEEKQNNNFRVVYAGNIGLAQDDQVIMKLAKQLFNANIEFTVISYGMRREGFEDYVKQENLDNVTFLKPQTREQCLKIMSEHQVGLVSLVEKDVFKTVLPGKLIDYMTCGIPIVASVSGISKEVIVKEKAGFVSNNNDSDELIMYIKKLRDNPGLRSDMAKNAKKYVEANFLWESNIREIVKAIE